MSSTINTNQSSINAQRWLASTQSSLQTSMARLSSGLRVNSAKDDAAGMAIASKLEATMRGTNVGIRNANDGISMASMADGALASITSNLQRMRELAVQMASGTISSDTDATDAIKAEMDLLITENQRVVDFTKFNEVPLLDANTTEVELGDGSDPVAFAIDAATGTGSLTNASLATDIDTELATWNKMRAQYGATQNQFESIVGNLRSNAESLSTARGRIIDADYAVETANLTRSQVLQQAGTAMVAQANQGPNGVLALLR